LFLVGLANMWGLTILFIQISNHNSRSKQLIREAVMENDFLKHLSTSQVREIVDYMEKKTVPAGTYVIREGDTGWNQSKMFFQNEDRQTLNRYSVNMCFNRYDVIQFFCMMKVLENVCLNSNYFTIF
jgi:hypothetical protein